MTDRHRSAPHKVVDGRRVVDGHRVADGRRVADRHRVVDRRRVGDGQGVVDRWTIDQHGSVRSQRGMGTMLIMAVVLVLLMLSGAIGTGGQYLVAGHRAQTAADLAALAGAQSYGTGGNGCAQAKAYGRKNHHVVSRCHTTGDAGDFVLTVKIKASVGVKVPGLPRTIAESANAGPVREQD
jgi:secretion/DNA translocation related TadE-like protein